MTSNIWQLLIYAAVAFGGVIVGLIANKIARRHYALRALERTKEASRRMYEKIRESTPVRAVLGQAQESVFAIERVVIKNFKNIAQLDLPLMQPSSLAGNWTCIAGINGAGKSAILQAICIVLLGQRYAAELGETRLRRTIRRTPDGPVKEGASIEAWVRRGEEVPLRIAMYLNEGGIDERALSSDPDHAQMRGVWDEMKSMVLVSYGAARNLTQEEDTRHESMAMQTRRQMTLFDPLTRIADVEALIKGGPGTELKRRTLQRLLQQVIAEEEMGVSSQGDRLVFGRMGTKVDAIDLPDGFRSTVAWLSDLCAAWHDSAPPDLPRTTDPAQITGILLLDEIDLHLHPSLSRSIVPSLRKALPRVQFVVTTHSPLVLSSFDRAELIVLEADEEGLVGTRELDRQLFAFSMDEVYKWLMRTPPHSSVLEEKVAQGDDRNVASYLYQSGARSAEHLGVSEADSKLLVDDLERLLKDVKEKAERK